MKGLNMATPQSSPQSPVDAFIENMHFGHLKPGSDAAIRSALQGTDMRMLADFNRTMSTQMRSVPETSVGVLLLNSLKASNGLDVKANAAFARKIEGAFQAIDATPSKENVPPAIAENVHRGLMKDAKVLGDYAGSLDTPWPSAERAGRGRRAPFNKAELTELAQHIEAKTATSAEIVAAQAELKAEGYSLGKFGKAHDGLDGIAGKYTNHAIAQAVKRAGPASSL
jgi:hypothetical protein